MSCSFLTWKRLVTFAIFWTAAASNSFSQRQTVLSVINNKWVRQSVTTYVIQQCVIFCLTIQSRWIMCQLSQHVYLDRVQTACTGVCLLLVFSVLATVHVLLIMCRSFQLSYSLVYWSWTVIMEWLWIPDNLHLRLFGYLMTGLRVYLTLYPGLPMFSSMQEKGLIDLVLKSDKVCYAVVGLRQLADAVDTWPKQWPHSLRGQVGGDTQPHLIRIHHQINPIFSHVCWKTWEGLGKGYIPMS